VFLLCFSCVSFVFLLRSLIQFNGLQSVRFCCCTFFTMALAQRQIQPAVASAWAAATSALEKASTSGDGKLAEEKRRYKNKKKLCLKGFSAVYPLSLVEWLSLHVANVNGLC
jgi:uncharacterized protein (DUF2147 family)